MNRRRSKSWPPLPISSSLCDDEWIIVQAQVVDNISIDRVEFYIDGAEVPFAISTVPPVYREMDHSRTRLPYLPSIGD